MTKADQAVDSAADKLETFVEHGRASGGVKAKAAEALADDPEFLRKLKPSLIAARVKGETPSADRIAPPAPSGPQLRPMPKPGKPGKSGGSPWVVVLGMVVGLAFIAVGALASWRVYADRDEGPPRRTVAVVSVMASALFALGVILPFIAALILPGCWE